MKKLPLFRRPYLARRILEIGGGHAPYAGVTHAVDKYPDDNTQRAAAMVLGSGVEFRQGDLESIPFTSAEGFDFLYTSHVLEHVTNPEKAIREINRVSKRGYLETPSPLREQIACPIPFDAQNDFHTQFCWVASEANTIHVAKKSEKTIGDFCECDDGKFAKTLFNLRRKNGLDIEPMLPRDAKTTRLYFNGGVKLKIHADMKSACRTGDCAYGSAKIARRWSSPLLALTSKRFRRLKNVLTNAGAAV